MNRMLFLFLACFQLSFAQEQLNKQFTPEELKADADFYFKTLYSNHPNPYYYYSLEEFENKKNEIYAQLNKPLTKEQFAWIIGEINSYVDWHSIIIDVYYSTFSDNLRNDIIQEKVDLFPTVKIKDNKLFLVDDPKSNITEINEIPVKDILSDCRRYFNWKLPDEPNNSFLESLLSILFYYKYKITAPYQVKFSSTNEIKTINKISLDEYLQCDFGGWTVMVRGGQRNNLDSVKAYPYKIYPDNSIAIFYINIFGGKFKDNFNDILKKFIGEVNRLNIKYIFYDLSNNQGGEFMGYNALNIIKHDTIFFRRTEVARLDGFNRKSDINEILLQPDSDTSIPPDRKLFVFQSLSTRSNGDYFCRIVKENNLGALVGENTGEPTVAFSNCYFYEMPNTKISFKIATRLKDFSNYFDSETLKPDIYWDVHHNREFTENELIEIINYYKKHVQTK